MKVDYQTITILKTNINNLCPRLRIFVENGKGFLKLCAMLCSVNMIAIANTL